MAKLEVGLQGELTDLAPAIKALLTDSWVKHVWLQCVRLKIKILMDIPNFQPQHIGDQEIMCIFLQHNTPLDELQVLNRCSMYLSVIWLSDICEGDGKAVQAAAWSGEQIGESLYSWPKPVKPSTGKWHLW